MRYEEVLITPDMAKKYLEKNISNRRYEPKRATNYAKDMLAGKWELNGEDIEISTSGNLKNGQHRLNAIIIANVPVKMGIKFDVPENITVYDKGRSRSTSDILMARGYDRGLANSTTVSIVKFHYMYSLNQMYASDNEIESFIVMHKDDLETVLKLLKGRKTTNQGTRLNCKNAGLLTAVFYALYAGVEENVLDDFMQVLYTGLPKSLDQSAAIVLRNDIQSFDSGGFRVRKQIALMAEKAIYDFNEHYQRKITYRNSGARIYSDVFKTFENIED